ncbi:ABC transporter substrate-binding protein [Geobacillus thermoleovorans]|uniref:Periplasmic binding domain protein n=1 Tax=Geobacillus kaustophilus TaxID=1462 RepID=A0A0D8BQR4_GEOKU|nr:ABC transporter substrate-binding protein [Geobacillus kaustophilus]KJE25707.1 periplasmic binding domain protein [Geobacillus kaustophilus]
MKYIVARFAIPVLFGALMLSGCGGGEKAATDGGKEEGKEKKTVTIGVTQIIQHPSLDAAFNGFKKALEDEGFQEGKNVRYNIQNAQGDMNNSQTIANNFVSDGVDLIFANSTPSAQSALNATKDIPIVFTSVTDPVGAGLVPSMDKAGENITGTTDSHPDAIRKMIQFIDEQTDAKTVGLIYNAGEQNSLAQIEKVKEAAKQTDLKFVEASVSTTAEVKQAAESLVGKADVFYIVTDNTVVSAIESVVSVANENNIPVFTGELDSLKRGCFAAYGFDYYDIGYQAGQMAAAILKGEAKPSEIKPEYPKKLKLVINKQAAEKQGIKLKPEWDQMAEYME